MPFDLSKVLFITTANALDTIPRALLDRMEVLRLSGYSEEEKTQIAERYLLPRQRGEAGLTAEQLIVPPETVQRVISRYTREAGVRDLERSLGRIARKVARRFAEGHSESVTVWPTDLLNLLGPERVRPERYRKELPPGVSTGLAWTETGGDVLYIEATLLRDGRGLLLTGQLAASFGRTPRLWVSTRTCSAAPGCTSTFPPAPFRRTGRQRASPWSPRWPRCTRTRPYAAT